MDEPTHVSDIVGQCTNLLDPLHHPTCLDKCSSLSPLLGSSVMNWSVSRLKSNQKKLLMSQFTREFFSISKLTGITLDLSILNHLSQIKRNTVSDIACDSFLVLRVSSFSKSISQNRTASLSIHLNVLRPSIIITIFITKNSVARMMWHSELPVAIAKEFCRMLWSVMHSQSELELTSNDLVPIRFRESITKFLTEANHLHLITLIFHLH